jgi:LacI family transcriptional regulator
MDNTPRVILIPDPSRGFGRGVLRGISRYSAVYGRWSFYYRAPRYLAKRKGLNISEFREWNPDGIICSLAQAEILHEIGVPMVCYDPGNYDGAIPCITSDDDAIGRLAAQHLIDQGHRAFAFIGYNHLIWSESRRVSFCQRILEEGYLPEAISAMPARKTPTTWAREEKWIRDWLRQLPKPVGVFCANDDRAASITDVSRLLGISIPNDISIIGADNDEIICDVINPPLSSVRILADQAGYEAAALLGKLIRGEAKSEGQRLPAPAADVIARQSTDLLLVKNPKVKKALHYITDRINEPIRVEEVVRYSGLSHRSLNDFFHAELGTSISGYITKVRIDHISRLLIDTDLQIQEIALAVGYEDDRHFSRYFKRSTGTTPLAFRRRLKTP